MQLLPEFQIVGNLRNGVWYIPPTLDGNKNCSDCYFKSTDGHDGIWNFSLKRINFHLYEMLYKNNQGCVIVDGTRRGKEFPDSLSTTIPIWCSILNFLSGSTKCIEFDAPPWISKSVVSQIEARLEQIIAELPIQIRDYIAEQSNEYNKLQIPVKPVWVHRHSIDGCFDFKGEYAESLLDSISMQNEDKVQNFEFRNGYLPLILYSASSVVSEGHHAQQHSWTYIQGAGDDEEAWSEGLTVNMFWKHQTRILASENPLEVDEVVRDIVANFKEEEIVKTSKHSIKHPLISIGKSGLFLGDRITYARLSDLSDRYKKISLIIIHNEKCLGDSTSTASTENICFYPAPNELHVYLGSTSERPNRSIWAKVLEECVAFAIRTDSGIGIRDGVEVEVDNFENIGTIGIICEDGRCASVIVALVLLLSLPFQFPFGLSINSCANSNINRQVRKQDIKEALLRLQIAHPDAAPPRSLMKIVNDFFMSLR